MEVITSFEASLHGVISQEDGIIHSVNREKLKISTSDGRSYYALTELNLLVLSVFFTLNTYGTSKGFLARRQSYQITFLRCSAADVSLKQNDLPRDPLINCPHHVT
jgi:hypothetical protein